MATKKEFQLCDATKLHSFVTDIFLKNNFNTKDAEQCSNVLLAADLRGIDSHGVARLEGYCRLIEAKRINPQPKMKVVRERGVNFTLDADAAIGLVAAPFAMHKVIDKLGTMGAGFAAIGNSNHFGIAGYHAMMALEHQAIGFSMTNASPLVSPARGKERMLGTNPICVAIPTGKEVPFVLDMATSTAANGKLEIAARKDIDIPYGWLTDVDGNKSRNPNELKNKGNLLPLGSHDDTGVHKGYGLSAWVDIFSGVLSGANYGPWVPPFVSFLQPLANLPGKGLGHFLGAWSVDGFMEYNEFTGRMDHWINRFKHSISIDKDKPVLIPGEPEHYEAISRKANGIPVHQKVIADLEILASQYKVKLDI